MSLKTVEDDRARKDVVPPPRHPLPHHKLFSESGINLQVLRDHLFKEGRLLKEDAMYLTRSCAALFRKEPNMLTLQDPITVCGDVHGQFFDLLRLFEAGGDPATTKYLFLGDYVDRGCFSTECVFYLFAHKIMYNHSFWMLRGNHECRHLTAFFNFKDECLYKYDEELYDAIMDTFDNLPIASTINKKFLACHGGLSPDISELKDIEQIDRFREVPRDGPFCDLLWADPVDEEKEEADSDSDSQTMPTTWFAYNETRQCSYIFGLDAVTTFLNKNNLTAIIRAHEACFDGYKFLFVSEVTQIPRVITIFSAPNYCDVYKNKGAVLKFSDDLLNIRQYVCSPHPYYLPNFMDVFAWSMPFVAEKVCDMLYNVLAFGAQGDVSGLPTPMSKPEEKKEKKRNILRDKVKAVSKLMKVYNVIRQEQDNIVKLKALSPSGRLPNGILSQGPKAIQQAVSTFSEAQKADKENEKLPDATGLVNVSTREQVGFRDRAVMKSAINN